MSESKATQALLFEDELGLELLQEDDGSNDALTEEDAAYDAEATDRDDIGELTDRYPSDPEDPAEIYSSPRRGRRRR